MKKPFFLLAAIIIGAASDSAFAQNAIISQQVQACTGSGTSINTTQPVIVCNAATQGRLFFNIAANTGTVNLPAIGCTDDGSTPSQTHYNWVVNGQSSFGTGGWHIVPMAAIQCISLITSPSPTSVTITAEADQTPAP